MRWLPTAWCLLLGIGTGATGASAQYAIPPGREADVEALFAPHGVGDEVVAGWTFDGFQIDRDTIRVRLRSSEHEAGLELLHLDRASAGSIRTPAFAVFADGDVEGMAARQAMIEALRANDDGTFWASVLGLEEAGDVPHVPRDSPIITVAIAGSALLAILGALALMSRRSRRVEKTL